MRDHALRLRNKFILMGTCENMFSILQKVGCQEEKYQMLAICANSVVFLRNLDLNCSLDSVLVHSRDSLADQGGENLDMVMNRLLGLNKNCLISNLLPFARPQRE